MQDNQSFEYTYSAPEQEEVRRIREKYLPKEESKLEQLRRLDASVEKKATMYSIILGVVATLVMGGGMSMCMVWGDALMIPGIVIGIVGIIGIALAYPLHGFIIKKERQRIAPEILRLTQELESQN